MKPHRLPPEFASLSAADLATIDAWLDEFTLKDVCQKLRESFNIEMDDSKLSRYNTKRKLARDLSEHTDLALDVQDILNLFNGQPVRYDEAGIELIQKRAFELLAGCRKTSPSKLAALLRIFHYRKQCEWTERRLAQIDKRNEISERLAKIKEAEHEQRTRKLEGEEKAAAKSRSSRSGKSAEKASQPAKPHPWEGMEVHEIISMYKPIPRPKPRPGTRPATHSARPLPADDPHPHADLAEEPEPLST